MGASPIELALEMAHTVRLLERLSDNGLDARSSVKHLRTRANELRELLCGMIEQDGIRTFQVSSEAVLIVYSHSHGGKEEREVKFAKLEKLDA